MNTSQRAWIFQGRCKNAFGGRFLMWLPWKRSSDFAEVFHCERCLRPWQQPWHPPLFYHHSILTIFSGGGNFPLVSHRCFWARTGEIGGNRVKMDADVLLHLLAQSAVLGPAESLSGCICLCPSSPTAAQSFAMHVRWSNYSLHLFWECDAGVTFLRVYRLALTAKPINSSYIANAVYFIHCTDS